jgi:hypothetical protein
MANIDYSAAANIRLAQMIMNEVNLILADPTNLMMYDGIVNLGSVVGTGSDTARMRFSDMGFSTSFASTNDGDEVDSTDPTFSNQDFQVGRYALRYDLTSLAQMTGYGSDLDPFTIAQAMAQSAIATMSDVIAATFPSFTTNQVGTSGVDLSVDDILDAIFELETGNNTQFSCILHSVQYADFRQSLRSESNNAFAFVEATAEAMAAKAPGFAGVWNGVNFYKSNRVTESGGNKRGAMLGENAVGYVLGAPQNTQLADGTVVPAGTAAVVEMEREPSFDRTRIVGNLYVGANITEQERGCLIQTDA